MILNCRAVQTVLAVAGSLKRENPFINENIVLIKALRDSNLPKLLKDDAVLFQVLFKTHNTINISNILHNIIIK